MAKPSTIEQVNQWDDGLITNGECLAHLVAGLAMVCEGIRNQETVCNWYHCEIEKDGQWVRMNKAPLFFLAAEQVLWLNSYLICGSVRLKSELVE